MSERFELRWPVDSRTITQYFGENPHIYAKFNQAGHEGLDFRAPVGANIYAGADGRVLDVRPNHGNAYGLHVRLQHIVGGREYRTIYAHLSEALVSTGQRVAAGHFIGRAGLTGHTYGPHLHLTLKLIGAKTPGYPDGVIDPLPYLLDKSPQQTDLTVYTTAPVRMRARPTTASAQLAWLNEAEPLIVLGGAGADDRARAKVGQHGEWIHVQRADGMIGYVAAWYLQLDQPAPVAPEEPELELEPNLPDEMAVYAMEALNVRNGPSTGTSRIAIALPHQPLTIVGDWQEVLSKVGDRSEWLHVRLPNGRRGYVAAWYVQLTPGPAPEELVVVYPIQDMNFRERPTVRAKRVGRLAHNTPLVVNDDPARASALVGRYDEWLYVRHQQPSEDEWGWVAAWYVSTAPT